MAGIYVHIPFCASFCTYCGFYSETVQRRCPQEMTPFVSYAAALRREMAERRGECFPENEPVRTLYIGGGTPSVLPAEVFSDIIEDLRKNFNLSSLEEFTVEVNPDDIASDTGLSLIEAYKNAGVNRISMGVQSFIPRHLRWMNRRHTARQAVEAFNRLREAGFCNISIDLIFGFASLMAEEWSETLNCAVRLAPEHISSYQMSIDSESALAEMVAAEKYREPSDEICAEQYSLLQKTLSEAGYRQYEISSFAKPGFESKHNSSYWAREPYLGLGAAAHSFDGDRIRSWNVSSVEEYCKGTAPEREVLSDTDIYNEKVMLGLRTAEGLPASILPSDKAIKSLVYDSDRDRFAIPPEKFFICDSIIEEFIQTDD
ncbi:MAG: radical SAM family heme chaperone HemW [Bacteroidales bacterium]|nr:radical SAM family heme chaperone HemW [Bacteroidales bacterium]